MRWLWIGAAVLGTVGYWMLYAPRIVIYVPADEEDDGDGLLEVGQEEGEESEEDYVLDEDEEEDE